MTAHITRRQYPENVIEEVAHDLLHETAPTFLDYHPEIPRAIAAEAVKRLALHEVDL